MATVTKPASDKQRALISRLMDEKFIEDTIAPVLHDLIAKMETTKQASAIISMMMALPTAPGMERQGTTRFEPAAGVYRMEDELYRVQIAKSSGQWYAQRAIKPATEGGKLKWEYLGKRINLADAEALDEAEAGRFFGYCIRCNAELTDPESIARGMGPVCASRVEV
ncbi:MAG TPA: DUF6011 domain-containing protein [Flavobacteriales bacterium]|jgi:hypothetical protein|nr:DUF6011 domain-containing protein [Flavobacteriales bacterium]